MVFSATFNNISVISWRDDEFAKTYTYLERLQIRVFQMTVPNELVYNELGKHGIGLISKIG
jgi:hypothetical protein